MIDRKVSSSRFSKNAPQTLERTARLLFIFVFIFSLLGAQPLTHVAAQSTPVITITGTLADFSMQPGTASATQQYIVAGSGLTGDVVVTAPEKFELSTDGAAFSTSLSLSPVDGTLADTAIYVRLNSETEGTYTGEISHVSEGAITQTLAVSGSVANEFTLTVETDGNGSVVLDPDTSVYAAGTVVTLTPTVNDDFIFSNWSGENAADILDNDGVYSITMDGNKSVKANFSAAAREMQAMALSASEVDASAANCSTVALTATEDAYISANNVTYNMGGSTEMHVDNTTGTARRATLIKWNLSSIPTNATISSANLQLYVTDASSLVFNLYNMRRSWVEGSSDRAASSSSVNWNTYDGSNSWGTVGAASTSADRYDTNLWGAGTSSFSSTGSKTVALNTDGIAVVQGWVSGSLSNYGLIMQNYSGSTSNALYFSSSEASTAANRPIMNVTYCVTATSPTIYTSGTLSAFTTPPGTASTAQTYTVSGESLTGSIAITAPAGFELSTDGSTYSGSLSLAPTSGTVDSTTIYVRLKATTEGSYSGNITHTSTSATEVDLSVSGTVSNCSTVALTASEDTYMSANDVTYNNGGNTIIHVDNTTGTSRRGALLKWDLSSIPSSATINSASLQLYISDASPLVFNLYNMRRSWVEGTSSQAASSSSANWNTYDGSNSWGTVGAASTSTDRYDTNLWGADTSTFASTGSATVALNSSGVAVVQGWVDGSLTNYGLTMQNYSGSTSNAVYFASSENSTTANQPKLNISYCVSSSPAINISGTLSAFTTTPGTASTAQTYAVSGTKLTSDISITAPSGFELSTNGSTYSSSLTLSQSSGTVPSTAVYVRLKATTEGSYSGNVVHISTDATEKDLAVSGTVSNCSTVSLTASADTYISANNTDYNNGGNTQLHVDGDTDTNRRSTLIMWDLSSIPSTSTISAASLQLYVEDTSSLVFNLYNMRRSWVEGTSSRASSSTSANWNTYDGSNSWGTVGAASTSADRFDTNLWGADTSTFASTGSKTVSLDSDGLAVIQGWVAGSLSNYGLIMQNYSGTTNDAVYFTSREGTTAANQPKLNVTYCAASSPTIATSGTLSTFNTIPATPSAAQSFTVSGIDMTNAITVTPPANFEVSLSSGSGFGSSVITAAPTSGTIASTTIYVRYAPSTAGTSSGDITLTSSGAASKTVAVNGNSIPTITTSGTLGSFTTTTGVASAYQTYTVAGVNLSGSISLSAPTGFLISTNDGSYSSSVILSPTSNTVSTTTIYVELYNTTIGSYSGNIAHSSSGATTVNVAVSGAVSSPSNTAPNAPTLVTPANGSTGVSTPPTLSVTATDPNSDTMSVSFYGHPVSTSTAKDFMIVLFPDIQNETQYNSAMLTSQVNWVVSNKTTDNIVFATTLGDTVNTSSSTAQYETADTAFDILDSGGVWYTVAPGNHDTAMGTSYYANYFGASRYSSHLYSSGYWFGGSYDDYNTYSLFSADGMDFILINLQYSPSTAVLNWADSLLTTYSSRRAIVEQHDMLNTDNSWNNQATYTALRDHSNLFMMVCGHMHSSSDGAAYVAGTNSVDGGTIHVIQADYQDMTSGNGYLRLLRFSPANSKIYMTTYSPYTSGSITTSPDQMDLAYDMSSATASSSSSSSDFTLIGTATGVASGSTASVSWTGLSDLTNYEWYAVATDPGGLTGTSSTWNFTTGSSTTNHAPVATAQSVTTNEDTAKSITLAGTDADGDTLTYSVVGSPTKGTLSGTTPNLTYTPTANQNGSDSFTFKVNDGKVDSTAATVSITITPVNDAPVANSQSVTTDEDTAKAITLTGSDVDGDTLTYTIVASPSKGTLSGTAPSLTYTPTANLNGSDSFTFKVNDGTVDSAAATVSITINAVNDAPVANAQSVTTDEDTAKAITLTGSDIEGSTLTYTIVTSPSKGTLTGTAPNLTYTPTANLNGADSFTFKVNDGSKDSTAATVSITINPINDAPVANAQSVTTDKNVAKAITLTGSDVEGSTLTYTIVTNPSKGTLSGTAPNLTYTPTTNLTGSDSFTFKVNDGTVDSAAATVSITINSSNSAPVANPQSITTNEDTAKSITLSGSDTDGDSLTYSIVSNPTKGTLSGSAPNLTYTPAANQNGSDSFTFKVNDGTIDSAAATVSITITAVNDAPVANAQSVSTDEDTAKAITLTGTDVDGDILTYTIVASPTKGTLSGTAPNLTYTPTANLNGSDSFTFKVNDGTVDSAVATVSITINSINDAPVANAQSVTTDEETARVITLTGSDVEGSALTYTIVTNPTKGTLSGTAPLLTYTPSADQNGSDSFTFKVNDGTLDSAAATVSITINPINDAPIITEGLSTSVAMSKNGNPTAFSLTLHATDVDSGDTLTWSIQTAAAHGTASASGTGTSKAISYTPTTGYTGSDSFVVKVTDSGSATDQITVNVTITAVTHTITITRSGTANVTITSSPSGINCGNSATACSMTVDYGTAVTLTATPASNYYRLASWAGDCTGNSTCNVTATVDKAITANIETATFSDVPFDYPRWAFIQALWDNGLTAGCSTSPLKFCPDQTMTRAESAAFLMRGLNGSAYVPPAVTGIFTGDDWTDSSVSWGQKWAEALYNAGLTSGCGTSPMKFCPTRTTTRIEGATFGEALYHDGVGYTIPPATGMVFSDLTDTSFWGTKYAELAYADGLMLATGTDSGTGKPIFSANADLDRSWAAFIIVKALNLTLPQ